MLKTVGEVSEWLKERAWKVRVRGNSYREFESLPLRHEKSLELISSRDFSCDATSIYQIH